MLKYTKTIIGIISCAALISCAAGNTALTKNWGKIVPDNEAKKYFETYQVSSEFNYYISGSDVYPNAILGLNKAYILDTTLWKKIEPTETILQVMVTDMQARVISSGHSQFGFVVLDNRGKQIGIWYSILFATAPVQIKEDMKVIIYTPDPDTYEKMETRKIMKSQ
ncbi:MAG: hypothetical protein CVU52_03635 [Deltaproteobacteria bacterium HGW-Deltaproteobacteria-10]|nr:MAG: hypothetical protein CVU52_03635 [Deltaproteobacteria bacterium HGW-Deltaproteobacteria-10]